VLSIQGLARFLSLGMKVMWVQQAERQRLEVTLCIGPIRVGSNLLFSMMLGLFLLPK